MESGKYMDKIPFDYVNMVELANKLLECNASSEQAIVVRSTTGEILSFTNIIGDHFCEDSFVEKISAGTVISGIVCMWRDGTVDVTSKRFQDLTVAKGIVDESSTILLQSPKSGYMICKYLR